MTRELCLNTLLVLNAGKDIESCVSKMDDPVIKAIESTHALTHKAGNHCPLNCIIVTSKVSEGGSFVSSSRKVIAKTLEVARIFVLLSLKCSACGYWMDSPR